MPEIFAPISQYPPPPPLPPDGPGNPGDGVILPDDLPVFANPVPPTPYEQKALASIERARPTSRQVAKTQSAPLNSELPSGPGESLEANPLLPDASFTPVAKHEKPRHDEREYRAAKPVTLDEIATTPGTIFAPVAALPFSPEPPAQQEPRTPARAGNPGEDKRVAHTSALVYDTGQSPQTPPERPQVGSGDSTTSKGPAPRPAPSRVATQTNLKNSQDIARSIDAVLNTIARGNYAVGQLAGL